MAHQDTKQRKTPPTTDVPAGVRAGPDSLEDLIERSHGVTPSPERQRAQRRSFTYGNLVIDNDKVTREIVARADEDFERLFGAD
jgi:hypothetical protein